MSFVSPNSTHHGKKDILHPYRCHLCEKGFSQKTILMQHVKEHTGDNLYHCDLCNIVRSDT